MNFKKEICNNTQRGMNRLLKHGDLKTRFDKKYNTGAFFPILFKNKIAFTASILFE